MSGLIDVHCHLSPADYPEPLAAGAASLWPCMKGANAAKVLHIGERPFRPLDDRSWDLARRIEDMDRDGVQIQVLSPMPELLSYKMRYDDAEYLVSHVNQQIADMVGLRPDRFRGLGAVPLQEPGRAAEYLARIRNEFGLSGVEIGSNVNGRLLGDPSLEPFFEAAESLSLSVFVHALHPVIATHLPPDEHLAVYCGFPVDVAIAATSILKSGLMERHPRLRLAFSHGGGALGSILGRLDVGWLKTSGFGRGIKLRPSEQVRRLYFDSNVYDPGYLRHLAEQVAPGQVFLGTDYPYLIMQESPDAFLESAGLSASALASVRSGAALAYLGNTGTA